MGGPHPGGGSASPRSGSLHGLVLAAGAGRRMGRPKATLRDQHGTAFVTRALAALREGGCDSVSVVLGAVADEAAGLLTDADPVGPRPAVVVAEDWEEGMGASLRAGLSAAPEAATCVVVTLVDLPDVDGAVLRRLLAATAPVGAGTLARASYRDRPGHPVLLGRDHWQGVARSAQGDAGARGYLAGRVVRLVECGDLATGGDVDTPDQLRGRDTYPGADPSDG